VTSETTQAARGDARAPVVREVDHQLLPIPAVWAIGPMHSLIAFECEHMMLVPLHGWFSSYAGEISMPTACRCRIRWRWST
jgi:hypothetical protein